MKVAMITESVIPAAYCTIVLTPLQVRTDSSTTSSIGHVVSKAKTAMSNQLYRTGFLSQ